MNLTFSKTLAVLVLVPLCPARIGGSARGQTDRGSGAVEAQAFDPEVQDALTKLEKRCNEVHDLAARFEEHKFTTLLKEPLITRGTVRMVGPRTRWDSEVSSGAITLVDRHEVRMYYPERKVVEVYDFDAHLPMPSVSPLPSPGELRNSFEVEANPASEVETACRPQECWALRLTPRSEAIREHIARVEVFVDRATALLRRAEVINPDGDRTVLIFSDFQVNSGLTERDLDLHLPRKTREIRPQVARMRNAATQGGQRP